MAAITRIDAATRLLSAPLCLDLGTTGDGCSHVRVDFRTPTELKSGGRRIDRPEFGVLFGRIRDRIANLRTFYQGGPPEIDFRPMGDRAAQVLLTGHSIERLPVTRRSSRTGQIHDIGGFLGHADYTGDLAEFLPWLRAAEWTGVGRHTVWGNGYIQVGTKQRGNE